MSDLALRLAAYEVGGDRLGVLPRLESCTQTVPLNELPTLNAQYAPAAPGSPQDAWLEGEVELAVEWCLDGSTWFEPTGGRFITTQASQDLVSDGTKNRTLQAVSLHNRLKDALVWEVPKANRDKDGKWNFLSVSAGQIICTLWDAAKKRGWGEGLVRDFTPERDSSGNKWSKIVTLAFDPTITLEAVVSSLMNLGMIDWQWSGRSFRVFNADTTLAKDQSGDLLWPLSHVVTAAGETRDWSKLCTDVLVKGEGGRTWLIHNDKAPKGLRRIEKVVEAGGVELESTARLVAQATLNSGSAVAEEIKREWDGAALTLTPWWDYWVGDWMLVQRAGGSQKLRVKQISVTKDKDGVKGHTTFGTLLDDLLSRVTKRTKGIVGAASVGGNSVRPQPEHPKGRVPATPQGAVLAMDSEMSYAGDNIAVGRLSWLAVTTDVSNVALTVSSYEAVITDAKGHTRTAIVESSKTETAWGPLDVGVQYTARVRAISEEGVPGPWSPGSSATAVPETEPPPVPSKPTLTSALGVLDVVWDGKGAAGEAMPADYDHLNISVHQPGAADRGVTAQLPTPLQRISIGGLELQTWGVTLQTVDRIGNKSGWSAEATITLEASIDSDKIVKEVERKILQSDLLQQKARQETLAEMNKLTGAMKSVAESLVEGGPEPPSHGEVNKSTWVAPDARIFILTKKGE